MCSVVYVYKEFTLSLEPFQQENLMFELIPTRLQYMRFTVQYGFNLVYCWEDIAGM